jgi:hypothetical protein
MMGLFDFIQGADSSSPQSYNQMVLRQQIAKAMLSKRQQPYPKTVGEGLSAIGNSIGDLGMMNRMAAMQGQIDARQEQEKANAPSAEELANPPPATPPPAPAPTPAPPAATTRTSSLNDSDLAAAGISLQARDDSADDEPARPVQQSAPNADLAVAPPSITGAGGLGPSQNAARNAVASALMQRQGGPQANPTVAGDQQSVLASLQPSTDTPASTIPTVLSDIPKAPDIALRPGMQLAQARTRLVAPNQMPPPALQPPGIKPTDAPAEPNPPVPDPNFVRPPTMPQMSPALVEMYRRRDAEQDPAVKQFLTDRITEAEIRRKQLFDPVMKDWETRNDPAKKLLLEEAQRKAQQEIKDTERRNRLGDLPDSVYIDELNKSKAQLAGLTASTASIARARALVPQMWHGLEGTDANMFLSRLMQSAGMPLNPKLSATEQFKSAMGTIASMQRQAIVGPGSQSEREMEALNQAAAADTKLTPQTIMAALDAAESLNSKLAIAHQAKARLFAGETDEDRKRMVQGFWGVPDMVNLVPQAAVNKLIRLAADPKEGAAAMREFDNGFNTPGLAAQVLRMRRAIEPPATPYQPPQTKIVR